MSLLVESIKILNGRCYGLHQHENRMSRSMMALFDLNKPIHIRNYIQLPDAYKKGLVKCRILYDTQIRDVQFSNYTIRNIRSAKLIFSDTVLYPHKLLNRDALDSLYLLRDTCDEILVIKNGLVTDAYYYNLVFEKNGQLYTPLSPLLYGTQRQRLIDNNKIIPINIPTDEIFQYERIHFINALTPLNICCIPTSQLL